MKAYEAKFLDFLRKANRLVIPIYQRTYSWDSKQCQQLWDDILRAGSDDSIKLHFVGSVVYIQDGLAGVMNQSWLVIDGQQRLTTVTLLLEALARELGEDEEPVEDFTSNKIRHYYLTNNLESGEKFFKILLSENDRETLKAIIRQKPVNEYPQDKSIRVLENFNFFQRKIKSDPSRILDLCRGLAKLMLVEINLSRDQDNPQLIFESMNSTGKALSQADLIRNFLLMGLEPEIQSELYADYWRPMEKDFGQQAYAEQFDSFMRHYLTVKTGSVPRVGEVYDSFKTLADATTLEAGVARDLVRDINQYAGYYCRMALGKEQNPSLKQAFTDILNDLKYTVSYPLLLEMYQDYQEQKISLDEFINLLRIIESYLYRRAILDIPTNSLNKTFAEFTKKLNKENYVESFIAQLLLLPTYRRFPNDIEFETALQEKDMYNTYSRTYWLRKIENFGKRELVQLEDCTIEHVMPQNPNLSEEWQQELGENWKEIQQQYLHRLGNLTLTRYNSNYSDKPYQTKLNLVLDDQKVGLANSPFYLNEDFRDEPFWNELAIKRRARKLAKKAIKVWPSPEIPAEVLEKYKPALTSEPVNKYTLEDHEYLTRPVTKELFESLEKQILDIDDCVTETVLKKYIAFKAETNFVDIIPLSNSLILSINIPIHELEDSRGLARDVSGIGRWGNGAIEVNYANLDDAPYVIGLIRQAFDRQMSSSFNAEVPTDGE